MGLESKFTLEEERRITDLYASGLSLTQISQKYSVYPSIVQKILENYHIKRRAPGEGVRLRFKHIDVEAPEDFPWQLRQRFKELIAVLLLTDGYARDKRIQFICTDKILQRYFVTLFKEEFGLTPTEKSFMLKDKETSIFSKDAFLELLKLSPSFIKGPKGKIDIYTKRPQPTLSFLKDMDIETIKEAIRLAMSTEGSICVEFIRKTLYPRLGFSCAHPQLIKEWKELFEKVGIKSYVSKSKKTWCKIKGLEIKGLKSIEKFSELGGFIKGVKITGKSRYYEGIEKTSLLKLLIESKRHTFQFPEKLTSRQKHKTIREMVEDSRAREKWWKICVEDLILKKQLEKERKEQARLLEKQKKIEKRVKKRQKIISFVKKSEEKSWYPTREQIERKFHLQLKTYFTSIKDAYESAGVASSLN